MAIFIEWIEETSVFSHWRHTGNGANEPVFKQQIITKNVRYSNNTSDKMKARAREYVSTERPEAKVVIR